MALNLTSCSDGIVGYSVVLWNIPEYEIADGTVVPVYLKSNITKVYIIGDPVSGEKIEVPLWKLSDPVSRGKANKEAAVHADYAHKYAKCVLDGLPIREETRNGSKQIYRLHRDEVVRTLAKGDGDIPRVGNKSLEGEWLSVLTSNGTTGWCFSYNLRLFDMNADGSGGEGSQEAELAESDEILDAVLAAKWYPDYYSSMIRNKEIDLNYMKSEFGFDTGIASGTVRVTVADLNISYPYKGVTKIAKNVYTFDDTPLQMTVRNEGLINVQYKDDTGLPKSNNFVTLASDVASLISAEKSRRSNVYGTLRKFGPEFRSSSYGHLSFSGNNAFSWTDFDALVPSIISSDAGTTGTMEVKYFIPKTLAASWDGVLTLHFKGMAREVNFLYKKEANGIRFCTANVSSQKDASSTRMKTTVSQASGSQVIFFSK